MPQFANAVNARTAAPVPLFPAQNVADPRLVTAAKSGQACLHDGVAATETRPHLGSRAGHQPVDAAAETVLLASASLGKPAHEISFRLEFEQIRKIPCDYNIDVRDDHTVAEHLRLLGERPKAAIAAREPNALGRCQPAERCGCGRRLQKLHGGIEPVRLVGDANETVRGREVSRAHSLQHIDVLRLENRSSSRGWAIPIADLANLRHAQTPLHCYPLPVYCNAVSRNVSACRVSRKRERFGRRGWGR